MYRAFFPTSILNDLDRLQRQVNSRLAGQTTSIRGLGGSDFPALNIGKTPESVEIYAFAPGLDPASMDVTVERGVLTLSGERKTDLPADAKDSAIHINERYSGQFRRAVSLPDDVDSARVTAKYGDGILSISIPRRDTEKRRRVEVQFQ